MLSLLFVGLDSTYAQYFSRSPDSHDIIDSANNRSGWGYHATTVQIERSYYALVAGYGGIQIIDITDPGNPATITSIVDDKYGSDTSNRLNHIVTARIGGSYYALVTNWDESMIQIINITDPVNPAITASITSSESRFDTNIFAKYVAVTQIGDSYYALLTHREACDSPHSPTDTLCDVFFIRRAGYSAVQIIDITNPAAPTTTARITSGTAGFYFNSANYVTATQIGNSHYALVMGGSGVTIINITDPANPKPAARVTDANVVGSGFDALGGSIHATTTKIDGRYYALVASHRDSAVQIIDITDPTNLEATSRAYNGKHGFDTLYEAFHVATVYTDEDHYALVASRGNNGIQIIDITDPVNPTAVASVTDGKDGFDTLHRINSVTTVSIDGDHYALATSSEGIQIIDVTDPVDSTAIAGIPYSMGSFDTLGDASSVVISQIDGSHYALVASRGDDGIQIIDITDPVNPKATVSVTDSSNGFDMLGNASHVATTRIGDSHYALVASYSDHGIQIIDITDPVNLKAVASVADGKDGFDTLATAVHVATTRIGNSHYALVASYSDHGIQIIDVTDPANPTAIASVTDNDAACDSKSRDTSSSRKHFLVGNVGFNTLCNASSVATTQIGDSHYALVASRGDDGIQIIDITDPADPTAIASVTDGKDGFDTLRDASSVATTQIGDSHYALVASRGDSGIQIIDITDPANPTATASATDGKDCWVRQQSDLDLAKKVDTASITDDKDCLWSQLDRETAKRRDAVKVTVDFDTLDTAVHVATVQIGNSHYALVASMGYFEEVHDSSLDTEPPFTYSVRSGDDGIQIIDITDPVNPVAIAHAIDDQNGFYTLYDASSVATAQIGDSHYALVASRGDDGIQIIDITNPENPAKPIFSLNASSLITIQGDFESNGTTDNLDDPIKIFNIVDSTQETPSDGGGCLVATAAYGSELAPQVQMLREIRDNTVMSTTFGALFMTHFNQMYYLISPVLADAERENPMFREAVRISVTPMLSSLSIMTLVDEGSEAGVLILGISVIALNLGMYIVAPTLVGLKIYRYIQSRISIL